MPDTIEEHLDHGVARCVAFNRRGTLLASAFAALSRPPCASRLTLRTAGCHSGDVVLWDFETRGVARVLSGGHSADVLSLSWSHDGRRVASACADNQLRVWDVLSAKPVHAMKLAGKPVRRLARCEAFCCAC